MSSDLNYKKYSLYVILDAYVTKNGIVDFLNSKDQKEFKESLISSAKNKKRVTNKINTWLDKLHQELEDIEIFLNDETNEYFHFLNLNRKFFDDNLPKHKRRIEWFNDVDRHPFNYSLFFTNRDSSLSIDTDNLDD